MILWKLVQFYKDFVHFYKLTSDIGHYLTRDALLEKSWFSVDFYDLTKAL